MTSIPAKIYFANNVTRDDVISSRSKFKKCGTVV